MEKIFKQSAEFCSEHEVWKLNVAHVFFMQENKFKDAIRYYEPAVKRQAENGSVGTQPCAPMHARTRARLLVAGMPHARGRTEGNAATLASCPCPPLTPPLPLFPAPSLPVHPPLFRSST